MASSERKEGPTPNRGAYSIVYFQDAAGNPAEKEEAVQAEAIEFDAVGNQVFRTYLTLDGEAEDGTEDETLLDR